MNTGIVTRNDGPRFWVDLGGQEVPCILRGKLKREQLRVSSLVVVGDEVAVAQLPDGTGAIASLSPRRTELSRPGFHGLTHVMAANVDQLLIVQSARQPGFKRHLAERFLTIAGRGRMGALVVVNKCDLEDEAVIRAWVAPLEVSGVPVLLTSAVAGQGIEALRAQLLGRISVLAGQSGVGKSSLVSALYPDVQIRTNTVSDWSTKGRHTTTSSRLYALPGGGYLADTPGIRELGLFDDQEGDVLGVFPEIAMAAGACKFRDCSHTHEPQCAVRAAVNRGQIDPDRYRHYLRLSQGG